MSTPSRDVELELECRPVTPERWPDLEQLFGRRGACGGCWCMWFRQTQREYEDNKGEANRRAMRDLVAAGRMPGILAFHGGQAIGWCSVAPREEFRRLQRSRILRPVDGEPVWSVVCLFVARSYRRRGVSVRLLEGAVDFVGSRGGKIVEGYAIEPRKDAVPDLYGYHGLATAFLQAGFAEVARRSATRPIMRRPVGQDR